MVYTFNLLSSQLRLRQIPTQVHHPTPPYRLGPPQVRRPIQVLRPPQVHRPTQVLRPPQVHRPTQVHRLSPTPAPRSNPTPARRLSPTPMPSPTTRSRPRILRYVRTLPLLL